MKKLFIIFAMLVAINANAQWEPDVRLTNDTSWSYTSSNNAWCIASSGIFVYTVWYDKRDGNFEIYYKQSSDAGVSWIADYRLTNDNSISWYPSIAVGSYVNVVWSDFRDGNWEIYYKRSSDPYNWTIDKRLTNNTAYSNYPSIAVSGSVVHVVWHDLRDENDEIYYIRSADYGLSWEEEKRLTNDTANSYASTVAVSGSFVYVAWHDNRDGNEEIYYKLSTDNGISWGTDIRLTNNISRSEFPTVAVSGSVVHIVWYDFRDGNWEIYYKRSTDAGLNWGTDTRLTNDTDNSFSPSVTVSGSVVHVVWLEYRDGNWEIYYKLSTNAGVSWGNDTRLTNNPAASSSPSVAVSGSVVHVVWRDIRDGNNEIYYKRNPTGNIVGINNISTETPSKYSLSQNYPNPFNSTSNLKFQIVNTGDVKLIVYDIMGKEVQTLFNERLQPGTYEAAFDGSALNSGVYFYKLVTGNFTETKRMLLIK